MHVPLPDAGGPAAVSRRAFLGCCSVLLAASSACAGLSPRTRSAYGLITDPPLGEYEPILGAIIEAILPGPEANFTVSAEEVRARLLHLFALETDRQFGGLQKALLLFDQADLFAQPLTPWQQEEIALDVPARGLDARALAADGHRHDVALYAQFAPAEAAPRFVSMPLDRRREYLDLWRASGYVIRRQFYASVRSLVMITTYSMDRVWAGIHYEGPYLTGPRR